MHFVLQLEIEIRAKSSAMTHTACTVHRLIRLRASEGGAMNREQWARRGAVLVGFLFLGVAGCGAANEETSADGNGEEESQQQDLTATVAIYECRTGNDLTFYRRGQCTPGVHQQIG